MLVHPHAPSVGMMHPKCLLMFLELSQIGRDIAWKSHDGNASGF